MKTVWLVSVRSTKGKNNHWGAVVVCDNEQSAIAYVRNITTTANMVAGNLEYGITEVLHA